MKKYICDVCKKEFGCSVELNITISWDYPSFPYKLDSFSHILPSCADICNDCKNKIADAQNEAIKKLKGEST